MRVQHNIMALNANRNLNGNNNQVSKSLEKLSSGYRINRAGDDAAGLAISEKMRAQISCLTQAETNCNDGISLIQTAEGALTEVHDMLNRMVELAEQSANGTYEDSVDRANLQDEVTQLQSEINRISKATNFNGIKLLDGSMQDGSAISGNFGATKVDFKAGAKYATNQAGAGTITLKAASTAAKGIVVTVESTGASLTIALGASTAATYSADAINEAVRAAVDAKLASGDVATADKENVAALKSFEVSFSGELSLAAGSTLTTGALATAAQTQNEGALTLQIGDTAETHNQLTVSVESMDTINLGVDVVNIGTRKGAEDAIEVIKNAINKVSSTRGNLGAMQNRLEHTVNNLSVTNENITNAESRIRDTDMAKEMMNYTSKNILTQAAQSMLAQANQQPQQVLSLLQ